MSDDCETCGVNAVVASRAPDYVRALWIVVALNASMFAIGAFITTAGGSVAVRADLLDFLGDALATGMGLLLVRRSQGVRATVSLWQGIILAALGVFALFSAGQRVFSGNAPEVLGMGAYGALGLCVNVGAALLLLRHRQGDASVRAVWLYSRNDAIGNIAVLAAAGLVAVTASRWPDVVVGAGIAGLFLHSAYEIITTSRRELKGAKPDAT